MQQLRKVRKEVILPCVVACSHCGDTETLEHLLCACPDLAQECSRVTTAYRSQGLPACTLEHLLFSSRPHLVEFLDETGIAAYR
ncbi:hypothetical protein HPB52_007285 [Rhipicephalus sanguineus]|uniref:Tick transposon n=1 Tax=Rhipicephalus sanguineus TaxID=34632 RepID=A0A9D4QBC4_RHISA|nr:hypothetical protein HPB52_007285 [Rhipicephalus sanguineus]